jgi:hypothetical protein
MRRSLASIAFLSLLAWYATPAAARISCKDGFQTVNGAAIATPYCQDEHLAKVAREYGMNITGASVRSSIQVKEAACKLVGYDIRVKDDCMKYYGTDGRDD